MIDTKSKLNNRNKALNSYRIREIISQFELSEETNKVLIDRLSEDQVFRLFCKKYSQLHGKTKQVKKEFLLVLAYSSTDNFNISDNTNFQKHREIASIIKDTKYGLDIWEKVGKFIPEGIVKDVVNVPFFDGANIIKNITFALAEYTNIQDVKDVVETIKSNGHIELNSIIKSATNNKKLFFAYMAEMHKSENSFIHNYISKGQIITEMDVKNNFDEILKELKIAQILFERLSKYNQEIAFFCETNDLINILNKSVFYLKLDRDGLLNKKDQQFTQEVFAYYHHRAGVEIMKRCIDGEVRKIDNFLENNHQNTKKSFLDHIHKNYMDHVKIIHEFYYLQTNKNINKTSTIKPMIDFFSINNSFIYARSHLIELKEYVLSDLNMKVSNVQKIEKIENNINLLIHNLKLYNEKQKDYTENTRLINQIISGNFKYSLPIELQMFQIVDVNGKPVNNKIFNDLFNETSISYQDLLTGDDFIKNERQVGLLMLSKSNFEIFKASGAFDEFAVGMKNKIRIKMQENDSKIKKTVLGILSSSLGVLMNKNKGLSEDDNVGIAVSSIKTAVAVNSLGGDLISMASSSLKIMDKASDLLDTIKIMALNKTIYQNIDETFKEIKYENKKIWNNQMKEDLEKINHQISINKFNKPNGIDRVKQTRDSVEKFLESNKEELLDKKVENYIKAKINK